MSDGVKYNADDAVEKMRTNLVHQCNAAMSMPIPLTGIAEISRQAEVMIARQEADLATLRAENAALRAQIEGVRVKALREAFAAIEPHPKVDVMDLLTIETCRDAILDLITPPDTAEGV